MLKRFLKGPNSLGQLSRRLPRVALVLSFNLADCHCCIGVFLSCGAFCLI